MLRQNHERQEKSLAGKSLFSLDKSDTDSDLDTSALLKILDDNCAPSPLSYESNDFKCDKENEMERLREQHMHSISELKIDEWVYASSRASGASASKHAFRYFIGKTIKFNETALLYIVLCGNSSNGFVYGLIFLMSV